MVTILFRNPITSQISILMTLQSHAKRLKHLLKVSKITTKHAEPLLSSIQNHSKILMPFHQLVSTIHLNFKEKIRIKSYKHLLSKAEGDITTTQLHHRSLLVSTRAMALMSNWVSQAEVSLQINMMRLTQRRTASSLPKERTREDSLAVFSGIWLHQRPTCATHHSMPASHHAPQSLIRVRTRNSLWSEWGSADGSWDFCSIL